MFFPRSQILLVTLFAFLAGLPPDLCAEGREIRFERLGVEDGLSNNSVFGIHQDIKGFMWFGTEDGLNRYDGHQFTVYRYNSLDSQSVSSNNIPQIFEDRSGTLWFYGPMGDNLNRFDRTAERFAKCLPYVNISSIYEDVHGVLWFASFGKGLFRFDKPTATFERFPLDYDTLTGICGNPADDDRTLLVGTAHGLVAFDQREGTWARVQGGPSDPVTAMHRSRAGHAWIGTRTGLYSYNCATMIWSYYPFGNHIARHQGSRDVQLIYEDSEGFIWIGIAGARIAMFDQTKRDYRYFPDAGSNDDWTLGLAVCEDRTGSIWVATASRGLQKYDRRTASFSTYLNDARDPHSLSRNLVNSLYEDRSGTLWIGTWGGGINRVDPVQKAFHHYSGSPSAPKGLSDNVVTGFVEDRSGMLWVTTMGGLNRFDRATNEFTHYRNDPKDPGSLSANATRAVIEDRGGSLWVASGSLGLDRLDPLRQRFTHVRHDPGNPRSMGGYNVLSLCEDRAGGLWIGYADQNAPLDRLDLHSGAVTHYTLYCKDSVSFWRGWIWSICEDTHGLIWICAGGGALNIFDSQRGSFSHFHHDIHSPSSLSSYSVRSFCEDGTGTFWIGTAGGLNQFDLPTGSCVRYTNRDGLENDHLGTILHDDHGCLWMSTGRGISKFNPRTATFRNYNENDGVSINPFMSQPAYRTRNGEMYFGEINGFVRFHPDSIADNPYVPPIVITRFFMSDTLATLDTAITEKHLISLSYDEHSFAFEFSSLNYSNPARNQFAYKLDGYDKDWIHSGTRRYASYTHLDPGRYIFTVKGSNNDGIWNEAGTSITLLIRPPYWQTWWFRSLVAVLIIGLLIRLHNYRVARLLEIERLRVRIATDLHDEIGSNLSAIALLSDLVRSGGSMGDKGSDRLMEIGRSARQMANDLRDIVWTVNPGLDRLNDMVDRMKIIVPTMLGKLSYTFQGQGGSSTDRLDMEFRRNILLMYKEILHNIQKHARATHVCILIKEEEGWFVVTIEDNGVGFDTALPPSGNGLASLQCRASSIGATLEIVSAPERGTRVKVAVKIP